MGQLEVRLLGPVQVCAGGQPVELGPARQRAVLAALAVDAGRPVSVDTLIERVWGERPPQRVRQAIYAYVTRIRKSLAAAPDHLGAAAVVRRSGGYLLEVDPAQVDLHRFRHLVDEARDETVPDSHRLVLFRQALALWRGAVLSDLAGEWADRLRQTYEQQRLDALVDWTYAEISAGDAGRVVAVLSEHCDRYPLNESLVAAMMQALDALGRGADALACYRRTYRRLVDELGVEPGARLQEVHRAVLCGSRSVAPAALPTRPPIPALLPPDVAGFAGRRPELDRLDAMAAGGGEAAPGLVIAVISGIGGVGKTSLAVHWAHRAGSRFPDGQLYVNLHGFGPGPTAVDPSEVLRGFLEALGVPRGRIPPGLTDRVALYRSRLANRRALVVLDNARDSEQVRPLLPGSPGGMALVTSRNTLTGMVAAEGATPLILPPLRSAEAEELVAGRLGAARVAADPKAVSLIIESCAGLPLALAIITARAATWPDLPLASFAGQLRDAGRRLDALDGGDRDTDVRGVFAWSYRSLDPTAARLFRLLSLHPGPHVTGAAAASLARLPADVAGSFLGELARGNLVSPRADDRYVLHDLLRAYAGEQAGTGEPVAARRGALRRLCSHYLHSAHRAATALNPHRDPIDLPPPVPGAAITDITGADQAIAWFAAESTAMKHLIAQAARVPGLQPYAWRLAWTLWDFFNRRGQWPDWVSAQTDALEAAVGSADAAGQAISHRGLVLAHCRLGEYPQARRHAGLALDLYRAAGDATGQAHLHFSLSWIDEQEDRLPDSLAQAQRALDQFSAAHHPVGQANAGNAIGWRYAQLGRFDETLHHCRAALALLEDLGDRYGQAATWDSLGYAHHKLDQHEQALDSYHRSLTLFRLIGDRYNETEVLRHLGDTYEKLGDDAAADLVRTQATAILAEIDESG